MLSLEQEVGAWDSVLLEPISEDSFVSNLHQRFKRDHIYTYIGTVLISVNPYKKLALYSAELVRAYMTRGPFHLPPHVYAVAGTAYKWLRDRNEDQCIIVSGESGSGKTEVARIALQFIVLASGSDSEVQQIKDRLVQAGTLLEAFGNARTTRNENASRFGKFLDIEFDFKGDPIGGHITHFLLEKTRVTNLVPGDRNFHVFYQLLTGAEISLLKALKLQRNIDNYVILHNNGTTCSRLHNDEGTETDKAHFLFTKTAFEVLGFTPEEIMNVFRVVATVLKLGNLIFIPASNIDGTEGCTISNDYELYEVCELLGAEVRWLENALTVRSVEGAGVTADLSACEAAITRDSLCKALYSRLFTWIVCRVNETTKAKTYGKRRTLGVLDIYGFENLEQNGLETLLINYCNERLHRTIVNSTLGLEQEEYVREGLEWTKIHYFDNIVICDLIDKRSHGILALLEEVHVHSDDAFFTRLQQCCAGHSHCLLMDTNLPPQSFQIRHYAGPVVYNIQGFVDKNVDVLHRDVSKAMYRSDHALLKILFPEGNPKRCNVKRPHTIGTQFKIAIDALVKTTSNRQPHYIRCIKPNELKQSRLFEIALVQHQVRYLSLMETVLVRRSGFSYRLPYTQFLLRYKMLSRHTWPHWPRGSSSSTPIEATVHLIRSIPVPTAEFNFGRTKLFIRSPRTLFELEGFRAARLQDLAVLVQKTWRCYRLRKRYLLMRQSQIVIAAAWRSWRECKLGLPFEGRRHLWCLYRVAREEARLLKHRKQIDWAVRVIQRHYVQWKRRQFLRRLPYMLPSDSDSPICRDWPPCPPQLAETSLLLRKIHHKWRCYKYRLRFDQTARNRMREKVTASIIFKDRKASYPRSVSHPFLGDYVRLRQNVQWKKLCVETNDQYVVFADIINKITRSSGKFVPILLVVSTSAMLILDQRTLQVKYRVPAAEIYRLSLSPYLDDVAVFHIRATSPTESPSVTGGCGGGSISDPSTPSGCLFQSDLAKKKGDFVFQTGHVIEIVTKLFLVVQNAIGKAPEINISTEFEANFGQQTVVFTFKCTGLPEVQPGQIRVLRKSNKMEVLV